MRKKTKDGLWKKVKPGPLSELFGFGAVMPRNAKARLVFDPRELASYRGDGMDFGKLVAEAVALDCVKGVERKCMEWADGMVREHVSPTDAIMDGREGVVIQRPYPWSPSNEIIVLDIARCFLRFPRGIPCALKGVAVDRPG